MSGISRSGSASGKGLVTPVKEWLDGSLSLEERVQDRGPDSRWNVRQPVGIREKIQGQRMSDVYRWNGSPKVIRSEQNPADLLQLNL